MDGLVQASFATMAVLNRLSAEHDLSLTQLRVLAILRDRRLRMSDLADHLGLEKSTLSGLVDRAEKRGLLKRARDAADGRAIEVFLSGAGRELAERLQDDAARDLRPLTSGLSEDESRVLALLLTRMLESAAS
ncbi:hypothetical protein ASF30_00105 [Leifsonia sp. Leaf264]|nr:hypothetical protein ASF30_00105 [Leifsonia sp. Leaf264]